MDKLVKLLNEYEREREGLPKDFEDYTMWDIEGNEIVQSSCDPDSREYFKYYIISKDYQFIKWLVDNDKINFNFVERVGSGDFIYDMNSPYYNSCTCEDLEEYGDVDRVLMLLAISDTPIDDLISYLR